MGSKVILPFEDGYEATKIKPQLIIWFDSLDCHSCRLKLLNEFEENPILEYSDASDDEFSMKIIISPQKKDISLFKCAADSNDFNYLIWIDENSEFLTMNPHLPHDMRLRSFLLDKNRKVVLIGDPLYNPRLWELYKTTIKRLIENGGTLPE